MKFRNNANINLFNNFLKTINEFHNYNNKSLQMFNYFKKKKQVHESQRELKHTPHAMENISATPTSTSTKTTADTPIISIHPLTKDPTAVWQKLSKTQRVMKLSKQPPQVPLTENAARVVCMSDTHSTTSHIKFNIPDGDIFIHSGDFTGIGKLKEVVEFNQWIGALPHKHKIVIAGNHELSFDKTLKTKKNSVMFLLENDTETMQIKNIRDVLTNCTYIEDELIEILGLRIYGSPWQPVFGNWAFNLPRGQPCLDKWNLIPENIDILMTHGPALGHGDLCRSGLRAGCVELLSTIQKRVKPKYHVFGHIHEDYGVTSDGHTIFINASTCDTSNYPNNKPIVFDIPLPAGIKKN